MLKERFVNSRGWLAIAKTSLMSLALSSIMAVAAEPPPADPAQPAVQPLSLADAQRTAFEHNWDLLAVKSDVDIATAQRIIAHEFPNPIASVSTAKISVDQKYPNQGGSAWNRDYDSVAAITQLIEIGGKRKSRQESAKAGFESARARFADARRTLELGVAQSYADALLAEANAQVLRESAASLKKEADIATARLSAGDISVSDKSRIEINARQFELDALSAEAAAKTSRATLKLLLGLPKRAPDIALAETLEFLAAQPLPPRTQDLDAARADLVAAEKALQKAEADVKLQKALRIPDPTFLAQYEHEPLTQPHTVGFGVSFPLPLWNRNRGSIVAAQAARDQAQTQVEKVRAQIDADIAIAVINHESALHQWQQYNQELRPKSKSVKETVAFAYEKGNASLLDLLSSERDDNVVRLAAEQAAHDAVVAAAALKAATEQIKISGK